MTNTNQKPKINIQKISNAIKLVKNYENINSAYDNSRDYLNSLKDSIGKEILQKYCSNSLNSDYIIKKLNKASEFERILAGYYLCNNSNTYDERKPYDIILSCNDIFGYYKNPTISGCKTCIATKDNLERLGIIKYAKFQGNREYQIPQKTLDNALLSVIGLKVPKSKKNLIETIENILKEKAK